jgi:hypothetical protein
MRMMNGDSIIRAPWFLFLCPLEAERRAEWGGRKSERRAEQFLLFDLGFEHLNVRIWPVPPHLVRQSVLLRKIESNVGGRIDDLARCLHEADHVQAAETSRQAAELDHPGFTPFPGVHTPGFMMSPRSGAGGWPRGRIDVPRGAKFPLQNGTVNLFALARLSTASAPASDRIIRGDRRG